MSPEFGISPRVAEALALISGKEVPLNTLLGQSPEPKRFSLALRRKKEDRALQLSINLIYPEGRRETVPLVPLP